MNVQTSLVCVCTVHGWCTAAAIRFIPPRTITIISKNRTAKYIHTHASRITHLEVLGSSYSFLCFSMCGNPHFVSSASLRRRRERCATTGAHIVLANKPKPKPKPSPSPPQPLPSPSQSRSFTCVIYYSTGRMGFICTTRSHASASPLLSSTPEWRTAEIFEPSYHNNTNNNHHVA